MTDELILAVDLKDKVNAIGTQTDYAERMGVSRIYMGQILNRQRSTPFTIALRSAKEFGSITLQFEGEEYELRLITDGPERELAVAEDTESYEEGEATDAERRSNLFARTTIAQKEMREFLEHSNKMAEHAISILRGECNSKQYLAEGVKEAREAEDAAKRYQQKVKKVDPEAYALGVEMALRELERTYGEGTTSVA